MNRRCLCFGSIFILFLVFGPVFLSAQGTQADYERAFGLREKLTNLVLNMPDRPAWIDKTSRFWYRKSVKGGFEFNVVDAATLKKRIAFDHERLAVALASVLKDGVDPKKLPFMLIKFVDDEKSIEFEVGEWKYACDLTTYTCKKVGPAERRRRRGGFTMWERGPAPQAASVEAKASPDGKMEAFIKNYNVFIRSKDKKEEFALSFDGSEGNYYTYASITWSPDSKKLAAYRLQRGYHRVIQYVESSPDDQLQPKYHKMEYAKPGDALDIEQPVLFLIDAKKQVNIDNALFPNPNDISEPVWWKDSRAFTFEYNQRGHQVYRIIEVDASTGKARSDINEEAETFFCYSGKKYRSDIQDGKEIIWMSERDGWNHLYLYDGANGAVKNQITRGEWVVRRVEKVDEEARQIYFSASGMNAGQDPYFVHNYRINFDGTGLTPLTEGDYTHSVAFSSDMAYYVDTWSRVDVPPVMELRRTSDQKVLMQVEKTDIQELIEAGWRAPEVFVAKGRDGKTDIWGIINRPMNFNSDKKYPVVELIYAGPQGSFVPKTFSACNRMQPLAEMGFIVVQIDGMGTNNRSKAFHDVCWKNLGDAGFPDRILWHQAVAAKYPYYDINRVGIYGNSAGGQNALGGLLFHPEFYDVGVSSCGCHDNRMDKIWWNEQWMGWPLGPEYAASSNVDNAYRLQGKLLLIVGELDTNVDPASTMQVVNALIKANKTFDLLVIPGGGHGMGGAYGERKLNDFFVQHLLGIVPPNWNEIEEKK
ncbi:MAG: S9 family peptidase [Candidatus Aminicenantes bacterium]|nr:S9 family peptidase [Candidatus Aminicenantes bacterium]MDH5742258.1 S9 family peptidase [Candidatus Aminicenantes bacterium]